MLAGNEKIREEEFLNEFPTKAPTPVTPESGIPVSFQLISIPVDESNFLVTYRNYTHHVIAPRLYNEWAAISAIASVLAQSCWIERGFYKVFPNLYVMLIGDPASGKGTTCQILQRILQSAGYSKFAPDRTTKEKFLMDLEEGFDLAHEDFSERGGYSRADDFFKKELFEAQIGGGPDVVSDVLILAEELSDFFSSDNIDFVNCLTKLWSHVGAYQQKIKTGKSVQIWNPCINMFSATTHDSFQMSFPPRLLGTGFLARFILVYGAIPASAEIAFPKPPPEEGSEVLSRSLLAVKNGCVGKIGIPAAEKLLLERIHKAYTGPEDGRFKHYKGRRFVQLLKLTMINTASRREMEVSEGDILAANTLLYATEQDMGKALGEFGKSRNAEVSNKIMQALYTTTRPISGLSIWKLISNDLQKMTEMQEILTNLASADKIQFVKGEETGNSGWIAKVRPVGRNGIMQTTGKIAEDGLLDMNYLNYLMG